MPRKGRNYVAKKISESVSLEQLVVRKGGYNSTTFPSLRSTARNYEKTQCKPEAGRPFKGVTRFPRWEDFGSTEKINLAIKSPRFPDSSINSHSLSLLCEEFTYYAYSRRPLKDFN